MKPNHLHQQSNPNPSAQHFSQPNPLPSSTPPSFIIIAMPQRIAPPNSSARAATSQVSLALFCLTLLTGFLTAGFSVNAQNRAANGAAMPLSITQAVEYGLQANPTVKNNEVDEQIASLKVKETTGIGLPQVSAGLEVSDFLYIPTSLVPAEFFGGAPGTFAAVQFGVKWNTTASMSASQLLFSNDYLVGLEAARVYRELARKATDATRVEVNGNIRKAYYTTLVNEERAKLLDLNIDRLQNLFTQVEALNKAGFAEKLDVDRLKVNLQNLRTERTKVTSLVQLSYNLLRFQMSMPQDQQIALTDKLENLKLEMPADMADAADTKAPFNYSQRVEYRLLETQRQLNTLDLRRYRGAYLPTLAAFGTWSGSRLNSQFDAFTPGNQWFPTLIIGARLGINLFDGLQRERRIDQARLAVAKNDNTMTSLKQGIDLQIANARTTLINAQRTLTSQKDNVDLATEVVRVTKIKYEKGVGSNIEVLDAETALKEAQNNYIVALSDALIAEVDYQIAQGQLK